jgi:hypothetical protein
MDVSAIESYRLPTWSFTQVRLNLGSGVFRTGAEQENSESTLRSYQAQFAPDFETFYESEDRVFSLRVTPTYGYSRFYREQDTPTQTTERTEVNTDAVLDVNLSLNEYVGDQVFVDVWTGNEVDRRFEEVEEERSGTEPVENSRVRVDYSSSARLGMGLGRVRNVTPVVRALRVRERMRELGMDEMGRDQVQAAAQQFARRPGYDAIYDRPDKYFWDDLFSSAAGAEGLSAYETFYLAESLIEPRARRFEGAEASVGVDVAYDNRLDRREEDGDLRSRQRQLETAIGPYARGRYVTNVSLRHQLSFVADAVYRVVTSDDGPDNVRAQRASFAWLWEIADRYRLNTSIDADGQVTNSSADGSDAEFRSSDLQLRAGTSLTVFVENSLALTSSISYRWTREKNEDTVRGNTRVEKSYLRGFDFSLGLRYYLFRQLK